MSHAESARKRPQIPRPRSRQSRPGTKNTAALIRKGSGPLFLFGAVRPSGVGAGFLLFAAICRPLHHQSPPADTGRPLPGEGPG